MQDEDKKVTINYWENVNLELETKVSEFKESLLLIHNSLEFSELIDFLNTLSNRGNLIYVSLTKTYESIRENLKNVNMKVFCVDCVSKNLFDTKDTNECIFEQMPSDTPEFGRIILRAARISKPTYIVIDSLSQFVGFSSMLDSKKLSEFSDTLSKMCKSINTKVVLFYDEKVSGSLKILPIMSFDKLLKAEATRDKIYWKN